MAGNNFGLNDTLQYFEIELDSLDYSSPFSTTVPATDWPLFRLALPLEDIAAIKILEAQIPFSYYVITPQNRSFTLTEAAGGSTVTVNLPIGNYNANTMAAALGTALNSVSPNAYTYSVYYDTVAYKLTIVSSGGLPYTLGFGLPTNSGNVNPRLYIGFPGGDTRSDDNGYLQAPNTVLITGPDYLYLNSYALGSDCRLYLPVGAKNISTDGQGPQMAKIPVNCMPGSIIYWKDPDPQKWYSLDSRNNIPSLDFYLTLGNGSNVVRLNGLSFSVKIGILTNSGDHTAISYHSGDPVSGRLSLTSMGPRKRIRQ